MTLSIRRVTVLDDAVNLIIHHVKRQSSIHSDEKRKIKRLLRQFLPALYCLSAGELSDDDDDDDDDDDGDKGLFCALHISNNWFNIARLLSINSYQLSAVKVESVLFDSSISRLIHPSIDRSID